MAVVEFLGALTLIFVFAKLAGWITWSWLVVFLPALVGTLLIILTVILGIFMGIVQE